jgi:hypothetical protein
MSVTPAPQRVLREGEVGQVVGFSRNLKWKWAKLTQDFQLAIYRNRPVNSTVQSSYLCNLNGTSLTWGYFEGSKEPVLRFSLVEPHLSGSSGAGGCGCLGGGRQNSTKDVTLVLHNAQELATWIRAIQILFANSEHQPVQQGDGGSVGDECTICLSEFDHEEVVGVLPCGHRFHIECITEWLTCSVKCPLCKKNSVDTSGEPLMTTAKFSKRE